MTSGIDNCSGVLDRVRIVLVEPSHSGNVGAAARAMKNMCLNRLYLVTTRDVRDAEASARAAGADDVLAQARQCASLDEAVAECDLVVGTSARSRSIAWPTLTPRACASLLSRRAGSGEVALVFGRERTGLTNEELERCHYVVTIATNAQFASLNLASAVQILAYELLLATEDLPAGIVRRQEQPLASHEDLRLYYRHLETTLIALGFLNPAHPRKLMRRLVRLFNRAHLDMNELHILRGILTAIQDKLKRNT